MTSLEELRTQLSDVDDQITDLYEKRMKICEDLGTCKIKNGYKTFDRQREKNKIAEVMGKVSSDFNKKGIGEVYELLLAISRKLQYKQLVEAGALGRLPFIGIDSLDKDTARVVFQGTEGAYSQAAMEHYFGKGCNSSCSSPGRKSGEKSLQSQRTKLYPDITGRWNGRQDRDRKSVV